MAADDDDDAESMEGLDYEEHMRIPKSDEKIGDYESPELEREEQLNDPEAAGVQVGGEVVPQQRRQKQV